MRSSRSYLLQKQKPSRKKHRFLLFVIAVMLLVLSVVLSINLISTFNSFHNSQPWAQALRLQGAGNDVVYLLYGIDYWGANPYVVCILLLHHDTLNKKLNLVYIPGNTMITTVERGPEPLGQLYRRLQNPAFIELVMEFTGFPVHHYFEMHYQGLVVLGDYLGGLETAPLAGGAGDHLLPADQTHLGGFELYRYFLTADYRELPWNQLNRQQQILIQLWHKLERKKFWRWPGLVNLVAPYVETDLSWQELGELKEQFEQFAFTDVRLVLLPGEEAVSDGCLYWVTEPDAVQAMVRMINEGYLVVPEEVKVEVLNGSGIGGLAAKITAVLENEGFAVVNTGNADHFNYEDSLVIAREEFVDKARAVALFVPGSSMLHQYDPEGRVDVTVIIGRNYADYKDDTN